MYLGGIDRKHMGASDCFEYFEYGDNQIKWMNNLFYTWQDNIAVDLCINKCIFIILKKRWISFYSSFNISKVKKGLWIFHP